MKISLKIFFDSPNYNNNKCYEKFVTKFIIYLYFFISSVLLLTVQISAQDDLNLLDLFLNSLDDFTSIFIVLKDVKHIVRFHSILK